jgi:hypothetical protein
MNIGAYIIHTMAQVVGISPENRPRKWPNTSWARKHVAQNEPYAGQMRCPSCRKCEPRPPLAGHNNR